ncbi:hypothetical protein Tco_0321730 [Tanacetum coccineum]
MLADLTPGEGADPKEDHVDYPVDGGDDDDEPSDDDEDDTDDEDEEPFEVNRLMRRRRKAPSSKEEVEDLLALTTTTHITMISLITTLCNRDTAYDRAGLMGLYRHYGCRDQILESRGGAGEPYRICMLNDKGITQDRQTQLLSRGVDRLVIRGLIYWPRIDSFTMRLTRTQMQDYRIASQESLTTTLIAHVSSLHGQLSAILGQIQALQARDQTHADDREGAASTAIGLNNMPPKRTSAARAAAAAAAPMTAVAVEQLI